MEGKLSKWTNMVKGWQYRWFVLDKRSGILSYYTSKEKMVAGERRGCLKLKGAAVGIDDEFGNTFSITTESKVIHLQARDRGELQKWIRSLEDTISNMNFSPNTHQLDTLLESTPVQDFGKKLEEASAFLQIMIQQINSLEAKMELENDTERKAKYECIINHSRGILDEVKQTIVLLQIAKNSSQSVCGQYDPVINNLRSHMTDVCECSTSQASANGTETSFSSVDEDEDFYDAKDSHETRSYSKSDELFNEKRSISLEGNSTVKEWGSIFPPKQSIPLYTFNQINTKSENEHEGNTNSPFRKPDGSLDYDALYDISDKNTVSAENHGSVVAHLLTQVKIGMDLTKVTLPTFILETRSLLEMYADYFAHPDMFVKISDFPSERERMVQVVRWYICSFHAGRKSILAKKPYNPVLGEIFQCHWDIPGTDSTTGQLVEDGPVPWCSTNNLSFVAEQVSHHPPVSAFYAEHFNKQISFNAFIWTKSKFLGLSIGVHNIGHGVINLLKYGEQYVVTFPNGYGRSILTVPWIELGGAVTITCKQTGYRAEIDFITKPFYGGKKHRISGEVYAATEKEPFLTLTGEWNGIIEAKWSNGKTEQFADVNNLPIIEKQVRPIGKQEDMESRKLWKEVTAGLKLNNVAHATNAKYNIEQKQRLEAQKRKEIGLEWETKLFRKSEDFWTYVRPLSERICQLEDKEKRNKTC